jgi:hypothetical protein
VHNKSSLANTTAANATAVDQREWEQQLYLRLQMNKVPYNGPTVTERNLILEVLNGQRLTPDSEDRLVKQLTLALKYTVEVVKEDEEWKVFDPAPEDSKYPEDPVQFPSKPRTVKKSGSGLLPCDCLFSYHFWLPCSHVLAVTKRRFQAADVHFYHYLAYALGMFDDLIPDRFAQPLLGIRCKDEYDLGPITASSSIPDDEPTEAEDPSCGIESDSEPSQIILPSKYDYHSVHNAAQELLSIIGQTSTHRRWPEVADIIYGAHRACRELMEGLDKERGKKGMQGMDGLRTEGGGRGSSRRLASWVDIATGKAAPTAKRTCSLSQPTRPQKRVLTQAAQDASKLTDEMVEAATLVVQTEEC